MTNKEKDILEWEFEELLRNIVQGYLKLFLRSSRKVLEYDRDQYDIGYAAARERYERPHGEWIELETNPPNVTPIPLVKPTKESRMNNRTEEKLKDISGMSKAVNELLHQAWERGYKYGLQKGYESGVRDKEAENATD